MADEPIDSLQGLTPMQFAATPAMDALAAQGRCGRLQSVPEGVHPGSEVANMTILGYDVATDLEGRGSLEAASIGVGIDDGEIAMRCNLITVKNGIIKNHSSGHISTEEADELIKFLEAELGDNRVSFHTGVSYRHLLKIKNASKSVDCTPPHDVPGTPQAEVMAKPMNDEATETAELINSLIIRSQNILANHPVNLRRVASGKEPANSIWPWSAGYRPAMRTLSEKYGIGSGVVISAVDLIKGIGIYAGLQSIDVEGATGLYDTNYEGKAAAALEALRDHDFVFLHIEASDEAGHEGDIALKIKTIENLDARIVKPIVEAVSTWETPVAIAVLPDHPTPCLIRTHTSEPVPFIIYNPDNKADSVTKFDEFSVAEGDYGLIRGEEFIKAFLSE